MTASLQLFDPGHLAGVKVPRYYQAEMREKALADLRTYRSSLAVMATGTGKTFTASMVMRDWPGKVLWLNERDNLVSQVRDELQKHLGEYAYVEQGPNKAPRNERIVVGSLQSMAQPSRLATFPRDHFSLIVVDEAHHSVTDSYRRIISHFSHAKVLGLTATPKRRDGKALSLVFEEQCADYGMEKAIDDGFLVPIEFRWGPIRSFDVSKLKSASGGDFTDGDVAAVMTTEVQAGIVQETLGNVGDRRGVLFFPRVEIAHAMAGAFNLALPGSAAAVDGEQDVDEKYAIIRAHKRGDFRFLCNCGVISEGHDDPGISFVGLGRPTKSGSRHKQEVGRGTRPGVAVDAFATPAERQAAIAGSWKPNLLVMDFVGNCGRHSLASPVDALAGVHDDEETIAKAKKLLEEKGGGDVLEAIKEARRQANAARREEAERIARVEGVRWDWRTIDPFTAFGMEDGPTDVANALNGASEKQLGLLRMEGLRVPQHLTFDDAQRLIRTIKVRHKYRLANFRKVAKLSQHGIAAQRLPDVKANELLAAIAKNNGWTPAPEVIDSIIGAGKVGA